MKELAMGKWRLCEGLFVKVEYISYICKGWDL